MMTKSMQNYPARKDLMEDLENMKKHQILPLKEQLKYKNQTMQWYDMTRKELCPFNWFTYLFLSFSLFLFFLHFNIFINKSLLPILILI